MIMGVGESKIYRVGGQPGDAAEKGCCSCILKVNRLKSQDIAKVAVQV